MINPFYTINVELGSHYGSALDKISNELKMNYVYDEFNNGPPTTEYFRDIFLEKMKIRNKQKRPIKINFYYEKYDAYDYLVVFFDDIIKKLELDGIKNVLQVEFIKNKKSKHKKIKYNYI